MRRMGPAQISYIGDAETLKTIEPNAIAYQQQQKKLRANVNDIAMDEAILKASCKPNALPVTHSVSKSLLLWRLRHGCDST